MVATKESIHCGECKEVIESYEYVGGIGNRKCLSCSDREKCWERFDEKHGLLPPLGVK